MTENKTIWRLSFDGSITKNPGGIAAYGYIISFSKREVKPFHGIVGENPEYTNNFAEYYAVAEGLRTCLLEMDKRPKPAIIKVKGDSQLVIRQMNGTWKAGGEKCYTKEFHRAHDYLQLIKNKGVAVHFDWIPRRNNQDCDDLSKFYRK